MLEAEHELFERDGVVVIRGLFKDWIPLLESGVNANEKEPGQWFKDYTPGQSEGRFWADYCNWQRIEAFEKFVKESPAAEVVKAIMGSQSVRMFHEHVLVKGTGSNKITPWHHDAPYYPVDAKQTLSLWIPLDPVARSSAVEFIGGSHKWGKHYKPLSFNGEYYEHQTEEEILPDIDAHRDDYNILGWDLEPGDAIAFNYLTIHGAPGNNSATHARRAVSFRWLGDEAVYVSRGGKTSPQYPHLINVLSTGDPLPEDEFPFVA
jgi:ectoine hydroxylase-related dioxygenase (phytanoyl-CoA dioxygenase family)